MRGVLCSAFEFRGGVRRCSRVLAHGSFHCAVLSSAGGVARSARSCMCALRVLLQSVCCA